jgi:acetate kinase
MRASVEDGAVYKCRRDGGIFGSMRVLALNCGSSSVKTALIEAATGRRLQEIRIENIGSDHPRLQVNADVSELAPGTELSSAIERVLIEYRREPSQLPAAVAHRVVHGGERFIEPTRIDGSVLEEIERLSELAPLHNPPAVAAIHQARRSLADVPHVAVFDTAFHATLPNHAREYALPNDIRQRFGIRRFGFHGINHSHVASSVATYLKNDRLRIISCHLGNGASVTAIENGRSVDTSMGMTPLEGLVMGTRAGDIDPGVLLHLFRPGQFNAEELDELLNKRSGLMGLTGSNDMRSIETQARIGDEDCSRAVALYAYRVRKYIGAYAAALGGVDVIAFTGGVGENSAYMRRRCVERSGFLGVSLNYARNDALKLSHERPVADIGYDDSRVRLFVVRADEELEMVVQAARVLARESS